MEQRVWRMGRTDSMAPPIGGVLHLVSITNTQEIEATEKDQVVISSVSGREAISAPYSE